MSSQKMATMLIIIVTTALKLVYINILMFKNYIEFMLETHKHFRHSCVVYSRHLLALKGTAKLESNLDNALILSGICHHSFFQNSKESLGLSFFKLLYFKESILYY